MLKALALSALLALATPSAAAQDAAFKVLGEFTPTTSLPEGAAIERLDYARKADLTRGVMWMVPLTDLAALFDLDAGGLEWAYRSGGYQRSIAPNLVVSVSAGTEERVRAFTLAWMYVYQQDAVPFYSTADAGRPAIRLRFGKPLTPARERAMYAALRGVLGDDAGYTRVADDEIVVLDLEARAAFSDAMAAFAEGNAVVEVRRFNVQSEYRSHDWQRDPSGESLLRQITEAWPAPGVESKLRRLRARYEAFVAGWLALPADRQRPASDMLHASFAR